MKTIGITFLFIFGYNPAFAQSMVIGSGASIYVPAGADVCAESYGNIIGNIYGEGKQCNQLPLPVELTSFTASVKDNQVLLKWVTETEVDNYGFEIEREVGNGQSAVGKWEIIGFVEGNGNSNSPKEYSFIDKSPPVGNIKYRLKQIDTDGQFEYSDEVEVEIKEVLPTAYQLFQNYPNPFNPTTTIKYALPFESKVRIMLYNSLGELVTELVDELQSAGYKQVVWNASNVASGVYIYTIEAVPTTGAKPFSSIKKMILLK